MTLPNTPPSTSSGASGFDRRRRIRPTNASDINVALFPTATFGDSAELIAVLTERRRIREYAAIKARMLSAIRRLCERIVASNETVSRFIPIPKDKIQREIDYVIARFKTVHVDVVKLFISANDTHSNGGGQTNAMSDDESKSIMAATNKPKRTKRFKVSVRDADGDASSVPVVPAMAAVRTESSVIASSVGGADRRVLRTRAVTTSSRSSLRQRSAVRSTSDRTNFSAETTSVLKEWFMQHIVDPYPTDREKQQLVDRTGITYDQCSTWYVNARMRHWKTYLDEHRNNKETRAQPLPTPPPPPPPPAANDGAFQTYQFASPSTALSEVGHLSMPSMMLPIVDPVANSRFFVRSSESAASWNGEFSDE